MTLPLRDHFWEAKDWCHCMLAVRSSQPVPIMNKQQIFLQQSNYTGIL